MNARDELDLTLIERLRRVLFAPLVLPVRALWALVPRRLKHNWVTHTTVETVRLVRANRVMGIAAEVSFWAVLSITPMLLISASALGWADSVLGIDVADDARQAMTSFVRDLLGIGDPAVDAIDELFDSPSASGLTVGILTSIYSSSRGFTSLIGGLDHITGRDHRRSWLTTRVAGFVAAILSVPALVALLIMVNVGSTGFGLPQPWSDIVSASMWPIITVGLLLFALALLHGSPAERTPISTDLLGATVTVVTWLGGTYVAARSLASFGADVLGILGGSVGLLFWLYIMTAGILIGAQVNVAKQNLAEAANVAEAGPDAEPVAVPDLSDLDGG